MERIQLCEADKVFFFLQGLYFFERELDIERISSSFKKVVEIIPLLSSTIIEKTESNSMNEDKEYFFNVVEPSNVRFAAKSIDDEVFQYFKPNGSSSTLSHKEGFFLHSILHGEEVKGNVLEKSIQNTPNVKFTILTTSTKKCILCFSINHAIADLHSVTKIMEMWTKAYSGCTLETKFDFSRERFLLKTSSEGSFSTIDPEILKKYPSHFPRDLGIDGGGYKMTSTGEIRILTFTRERIEDLKKEVIENKGPKKYKISSFDVISAFLWKLQALKETTDPNRIVPLHIVVDLRSRIDDLPEDYFGNAFLCPGIEICRKEILDADLSTLAKKIRSLITSVSKEDLLAVLFAWKKSPPVFQRINALFVDDWRLFDRVKPIFSPQTCTRSVLMPPYRSDVLDKNWAFIGLGESGGITVRIVFEKKFLERFGNLDLTNLETIEFIRNHRKGD